MPASRFFSNERVSPASAGSTSGLRIGSVADWLTGNDHPKWPLAQGFGHIAHYASRFPSAGSDYDVRFTYLQPRDWYLSVDLER